MSNDELDKIWYKNNFLKKVIFRLDYNPILSLQESLESGYQDDIKSIFPLLSISTAHGLTAELKDGIITQGDTVFNQYTFETSEKDIKVTICFTSLIIEWDKYKSFTDVKNVVNLTIPSLLKYYEPISFNRLGFRYINEIVLDKGNPFKWQGYINPILTKVIEADFFSKEKMARAMSQYTINKEDYIIICTYGIYNSEFPAPIRRKEFILDFDCSTKDIRIEKIPEDLRKYNLEILSLFEQSIGPKLREKMNLEVI